MMPRTTFALLTGMALFAPAFAHASLESEAVTDYHGTPGQIVEMPRETRWFGVPNVSEFDPAPAELGATSITSYPPESIQERDD